ncbi:MAG: DUF4124 domain-containing protein [Casimicrobiaceae bacterium]
MKRRYFAGAMPVGGLSAGLLLLLLAPGAGAEVVKCIDVNGNITYQDVPCTGGQAGRKVELPKSESLEDTSAWEAAARDARVVKGMPKRWVLRSRGAPVEIRPPAAREDATEVWRYAAKDGALLIGFAGPNVAWIRDESATRAAPPPPGAADNAAAKATTRGAQNRRFVIAGRFCEHVFAEIGSADREEPLATTAADAAPVAAAPGTRYIYEPQAGDPQMRTVFSCVGGKVADVERTVVK